MTDYRIGRDDETTRDWERRQSQYPAFLQANEESVVTPFKQEIRDAGRGHLIPDYDLWDIYGEEIEDEHEYICDAQEARIDAGDGEDSERGSVAVAVLSTILALVVIVGIAVGGYQLNWWLRGQNVNRTAKINRTSYEVQQTYREKALDNIASVRAVESQIAEPSTSPAVKQQLRAQRVAIVTQSCDAISRLTTSGAGVDPDIQSFHDSECL